MYPFVLVVEVMDGCCSISNSCSSSGTYSGRRSSTRPVIVVVVPVIELVVLVIVVAVAEPVSLIRTIIAVAH